MYLNIKILKYLIENLSRFSSIQFIGLYINKYTLQFKINNFYYFKLLNNK